MRYFLSHKCWHIINVNIKKKYLLTINVLRCGNRDNVAKPYLTIQHSSKRQELSEIGNIIFD